MRIRRPLNITSRSSSITNCFVQAIIPSIEPTSEEVAEALSVLGMSIEKISCVYCGSRTTDWDHLRPLVRGKRPTGYITEIRNLVPACGPCNQSKGGSDWEAWMNGKARGSPKTRGISDLQSRIEKLRAFEVWGAVQPLSLGKLANEKLWNSHWAHLDSIINEMRTAQAHAELLRISIWEKLRKVAVE
jgi:hypothetical protein